MGHHVIRQPNGKLALFSTIVDDFLVWDATKEELMAYEFAQEQQRLAEQMARWEQLIVRTQETGTGWPESYTWGEALAAINAVHGQERADEYRGLK
jgi:hypothetical protein